MVNKSIFVRTLLKNKANQQFSITLPKKEIVGLRGYYKKNLITPEPKKIKIKIKELLW